MDTGKVSFQPKEYLVCPKAEIPPFNWKGTFSVPILSIRIRPQAFSPPLIWLLPHPLPLSHQSARPATLRKTEKDRELVDGRRGR
jgi:hypothetical protein